MPNRYEDCYFLARYGALHKKKPMQGAAVCTQGSSIMLVLSRLTNVLHAHYAVQMPLIAWCTRCTL